MVDNSADHAHAGKVNTKLVEILDWKKKTWDLSQRVLVKVGSHHASSTLVVYISYSGVTPC